MMRNQTASQAIVVVAMGLVAGTGAVALYQHAGMPGAVAATTGLAAYLLLLTVHAYLWRKERGARKDAAPRGQRTELLRRQQDGLRAPPPMPHPSMTQASMAPMPQGGFRPGQGPFSAASNGAAAGHAPMPPKQTPPPVPQHVPAAPQPRQAAERTGPPPIPASPSPNPMAAPQAAAPEHDDFWSFRPNEAGEKLPSFLSGRGSDDRNHEATPDLSAARGSNTAASQQAQPRAKATAPREADVEVIQDAIKRLLEEVNAAEQNRHPPRGPQNSAAQAAAGSAPPPLPEQQSSESHIERSIEALRMTAGSMRSAAGSDSGTSASNNAPPPVPPQYARNSGGNARAAASADARARLMADAISAGRIDVTLEPILGLEDQQTRHYEVSVRLRDNDGNPLEVTPEGPNLRGTGLLPLFDGIRVTRTAAVARRLEDRGKAGSVFSTFSGESVSDEHFLGELAETLHLRSSLASQLVLSFTQTDVRGFSTPEWDSLADMRALGFRFAISHLTDLEMDFEALAEQGFVFAKLDAPVFLDGMRSPSGHIPASDVCRHLAKHQLTLVVEHIDDDELLARVFGFGVLLGQGQLFGGPRPVRAEVANERSRNSNAAGAARAMA